MSRTKRSDRLCVEDCLSFDIAGLVRDGVFRVSPGTPWAWYWKDESGHEIFRLSYWLETSATGKLVLRVVNGVPTVFTRRLDDTIEIAETRLHFGPRKWFLCPRCPYGIPCRQRVRILYIRPGERSLGCRKCHDLVHMSAQKHDKRLDPLLKHDPAEFARMLASDNFTEQGLAIRAIAVLIRRARKRQRDTG